MAMTIDDKVILPEKDGCYKAILVDIDGALYVRCGDEQNRNRFHGEILQRLLDEKRVSYQTFRSPVGRDGDHIDIPKVAGERYKAIGMGTVEINLDSRKIEFWGESASYQIGFEEVIGILQGILPGWEVSHIDIYKNMRWWEK